MKINYYGYSFDDIGIKVFPLKRYFVTWSEIQVLYTYCINNKYVTTIKYNIEKKHKTKSIVFGEMFPFSNIDKHVSVLKLALTHVENNNIICLKTHDIVNTHNFIKKNTYSQQMIKDWFYLRSKKFQKECNRVLENDPDDFWANKILGLNYFEQRLDYFKSYQLLKNAFKIDSTDLYILHSCILIAFAIGEANVAFELVNVFYSHYNWRDFDIDMTLVDYYRKNNDVKSVCEVLEALEKNTLTYSGKTACKRIAQKYLS